MSVFAFLLVLAAAFCHATWNFYVKRLNGGAELAWLFAVVSSILYLPIAIFIFIVDKPVFGLLEFGFVFGSAIIHLGYFLLLQAGYRSGDLSLVYPTARATGPLLSVTLAVLFLGEFISLQIACGAVIIIIGVVSLTGGFSKRPSNFRTSLLFGIGSGTFIGCYTVWDAHAVSTIMISPLILEITGLVCRAAVLTPVGLRRMQIVKTFWKEQKRAVLIVSTISPLAYVLVLYAMTFTPVVYVAPLRESSVLLTVLMGSILLGEGDLKRRLGWAVVIVSGVILLATG
ncbi:MAG: DMT family transporter [Rhodospirillales bacterium]|jgi:drug/metabolite transporter (DMT)-like permease|nr:DMT family transporter [Rhodospirillales bacterium]